MENVIKIYLLNILYIVILKDFKSFNPFYVTEHK